jgi:hypothetical protein
MASVGLNVRFTDKMIAISRLALIVAWLTLMATSLPGNSDLPQVSTKTSPSSSSSNAAGPARSSKLEKRQKNRHRRLKVTRIRAARKLKPMPALSETPFPAEVALLPLIENAKSRLEKERVSYFPATKRGPAQREIKLALANFKTGEIQIVPGVEEKGRFSLRVEGIRYQVSWWNGFNSSIDILEPADTGVVALLYALEPKRQSFYGQDAIIYTPFSSALLQPELVEAGKVYLMGKIKQACQQLNSVKSKAFPHQTLSSSPAFNEEDYFHLILAEQMDPGRFRSITEGETEFSEEQALQLVRLAERILVIIGANQEDAYSFTGNYASARGLTQFTPSGMWTVWRGYPEAGIPRNFKEATGNHTSAIKAEICLLDYYLAELSSEHPNLMGSGFEKYASGACYNGGPKRVHYGLSKFGMEWLNPLMRLQELSQKGQMTRSERLEYQWLKRYRAHETYVYLGKMHALESLQGKLELPHLTENPSEPGPENPEPSVRQ